MAIKVFEGKNSNSGSRKSTEYVGKVSVYHKLPGDRQSTEQEGLVFSEMSEEVAEAVADLFDSSVEPEADPKGYVVFTTAQEVDAVLVTAETKLIQFAPQGPPLRICDGATQIGGDYEGEECFCTCPKQDGGLGLTTVKEIKQDRRACSPNASALFSIPELSDVCGDGLWRVQTGSLGSLESFEDAEGMANGTEIVLRNEQVRFTAKSGENVSYSFLNIELRDE